MIHEAEVFLMADEAAERTFGLVREKHDDEVLPPVFDMPGADRPVTLRQLVAHVAYDEAWIPDLLAGRTMDEVGRDRYDGDLLGADPRPALAELCVDARAAARDVADAEAVVHCSFGDISASGYFWQLNIARCLTAHDVAVHFGEPCPLSEELCRAMWEGTAPTADMWSSFGVYRSPVPVPDDASWRTRYLALTGRTAATR